MLFLICVLLLYPSFLNSFSALSSINFLKRSIIDRKSSKQEIDDCLNKCFINSDKNNNKEFQLQLNDIYSTNWLLEYSSLLPSGWFPIQEVCDFNNEFQLESRFGPIPLGRIKGHAQMVDHKNNKNNIKNDKENDNNNNNNDDDNNINIIRIEFIGNTFSLGPFTISMNNNGNDKSKSKYYDFIHVDKDIAIAKSSSGGYSILTPYNQDMK